MSEKLFFAQDRFSPRAYDPDFRVDEDTVTTLLQAARWAPSGMNYQPWKFILEPKGTPGYEKLARAVAGRSDWAVDASVLGANLVDSAAGSRWGMYDLGGAVQHLLLEAHSRGLQGRVLASFDAEVVRREFGLPDSLEPVTMIAIGRAAQDMPERQRKSLDEIRIR